MGELFAVMLVPITAILTTGTVLLLRPVTTRLGALLEVMTEERRRRAASPEAAQVRELMASLDSRLALMEERQDFAEALLSSGERRARPAPQSLSRVGDA